MVVIIPLTRELGTEIFFSPNKNMRCSTRKYIFRISSAFWKPDKNSHNITNCYCCSCYLYQSIISKEKVKFVAFNEKGEPYFCIIRKPKTKNTLVYTTRVKMRYSTKIMKCWQGTSAAFKIISQKPLSAKCYPTRFTRLNHRSRKNAKFIWK